MKKDYSFYIIILQVLTSLTVIFVLLFMKFFLRNDYTVLKNIYNKTFLQETKIEEFFSYQSYEDFKENEYKVIIDEN